MNRRLKSFHLNVISALILEIDKIGRGHPNSELGHADKGLEGFDLYLAEEFPRIGLEYFIC